MAGSEIDLLAARFFWGANAEMMLSGRAQWNSDANSNFSKLVTLLGGERAGMTDYQKRILELAEAVSTAEGLFRKFLADNKQQLEGTRNLAYRELIKERDSLKAQWSRTVDRLLQYIYNGLD